MKISGVQYYWMVAFGLIAGLVFALIIGLYGKAISGNTMYSVGALILLLVAAVAYLIVALEIWDRFGLSRAVIAFVIFPISIFYWFSRIAGIDDAKATRH
jgi:hypothetical protein